MLHVQKEFLIGSGFIEKLEIFSGPLPIKIPSDLINLFAVLLQILSPVPQISIFLFSETDKFGNFCVEIRSVLMSLYCSRDLTTIIFSSISEKY